METAVALQVQELDVARIKAPGIGIGHGIGHRAVAVVVEFQPGKRRAARVVDTQVGAGQAAVDQGNRGQPRVAVHVERVQVAVAVEPEPAHVGILAVEQRLEVGEVVKAGDVASRGRDAAVGDVQVAGRGLRLYAQIGPSQVGVVGEDERVERFDVIMGVQRPEVRQMLAVGKVEVGQRRHGVVELDVVGRGLVVAADACRRAEAYYCRAGGVEML